MIINIDTNKLIYLGGQIDEWIHWKYESFYYNNFYLRMVFVNTKFVNEHNIPNWKLETIYVYNVHSTNDKKILFEIHIKNYDFFQIKHLIDYLNIIFYMKKSHEEILLLFLKIKRQNKITKILQ